MWVLRSNQALVAPGTRLFPGVLQPPPPNTPRAFPPSDGTSHPLLPERVEGVPSTRVPMTLRATGLTG